MSGTSGGTSRYVVIGAGLAGAATAWSLAKRGHEVTLVERTRPAARDGSSHGSARIFRYAYANPLYTELVVRARAGFDELERLSGRQLVDPVGAVDHGRGRDPRQLASVLEQVGVEHELWSVEQARERFPQITPDSEVLWQPGAGVLDPETTVRVLVAGAEEQGAQVLLDWPVAEVAASAAGYRVHGERGHLDAERVVVAVGGWLPSLLPRLPLADGFRAALPRLVVSQENAYHFPYRELAQHWPTTIHRNDDISTYSLPGGRDAGFRGQKVAEFGAGRSMASAADQDGRIDPANRRRMVTYVERNLPGLVPEPYAETTCLFTMTPTEDFLIDRCDQLTIVSACSGHGAKFAPVLGELAADAATGDAPVPELFRVGSAPATWRG